VTDGKQMKLKILTVDKEALNVETGAAVFPGREGEFTVLPGHTMMTSRLKEGDIRYIQDGSEKRFNVIGSGFVEIKDNIITVIIS